MLKFNSQQGPPLSAGLSGSTSDIYIVDENSAKFIVLLNVYQYTAVTVQRLISFKDMYVLIDQIVCE